MTVAIKIRPVRSGDWTRFEQLVAGICQYHGDTHGLTRTVFDTMAIGNAAPVITLVAETDDGQLVGFAAGFPVYNFHMGVIGFEIHNLFVAEAFRRQRIGEVLMISIIQAAKQKHNATRFKIGAQSWNAGAIEFYKQLGFNESTQSKETVSLVKQAA